MGQVFLIPTVRWVLKCGLSLYMAFCLVVFQMPASAQSVRVLSTQNGLPQSFVSALVQDDAGFIWIGTRNGLSRFDGVQHKIFQHNTRDTTSIAANIISWMVRDKNNNIWIEYESGEMDRLDPVTEKIYHYIGTKSFKNMVQSARRGWLVDSSGILWSIVKGGMFSYNKKLNSVIQYSRATNGLPSDTLRGLLEDRDNRLWVLSQLGLSRFDEKSKKFSHIQLPYQQDFNNYFGSDAEVVDLHQRQNGELMWGDRQKLYFFKPDSQHFRTISLPVYPRIGIKWIRTGPEDVDYLECNGVVYSYDDIHGLRAVGNAEFNNLEDARSFMVDRSGLIWIGANAAGIHQIDLITPFFISHPQNRFFPQELLQKEMGLSMTSMFNWTEKDEEYYPSGYHFRSAYAKNGILYLGLKDNIYRYDYLKKTSTMLPRPPLTSNTGDPGIGIKGVTVTPAGVLMVLGYSGHVLSYNEESKTWEAFIDPMILRKTFGAGILPIDLFADDSKIWITTSADGLIYIDAQTKKINQLKAGEQKGDLPTNQLIGFRKDPTRPDLLWIGSYQGLIGLNKKTMKCDVYSLDEGLPDNTIYSIQSDRTGNLWLSTNKGLCRFNPITHQIRIFKSSYGLPGDEFNRFHHFELPDGRLAFGGTQGWTIFNPLFIKNDDYEPKISLTNLRINNNPINPGKNTILSGPLNSINKLDLSFSDNTIAIVYAGLQFNQPQDLLYRYRLVGYDDDWVMAAHGHTATYTKIPPGNYTLMVNASNTNGKWSSHIKSIQVNVKPPWWRTWWAYVCYSIILFALLWGYINFRVSRGLMEQEMQLKEKEARQLREVDEMKTRFFSNITHEFRTPLTLIMGPAEELKNRYQNDPQQTKLADIIKKSAGQLLLLINQLMDLAKLEAKAIEPQQKKANLAATIGSVVYSFENEASNKNIRLAVKTEAVQKDYWFAPDALERIVYNLVSNALKFTPKGGEIVISVSPQNQGIKLMVQDTGIGIAEDKLPHIFDRFYQVDEVSETDSGKYPVGRQGTGIGLSIVKELVDLQHGTIDVESETSGSGKSSGTLFTIALPYREAEEDIEEELLLNKEVVVEEETETETEKRPQILLVEDNAELAEFIKGSLQQYYNVQHEPNGALGVQAALTVMPDLIISDVLMPVMDGFTLVTKIKEDIRTSHIPVILLTAKVSQDSRIEGLTKGADDYLTKPFHTTELLLRIRNLLEQQRRIRDYVRKELVRFAPSAPTVSQKVETQEAPPDPFLTKLYGLVEEHLDDPLFGVDQLVSSVDMSRTSLHRKIKALAGMTTTELVRNYRLKRSTEFLRKGHNSSDTAYMSGFGSPSYFTKCFREVYGITPGEFIQQNSKA